MIHFSLLAPLALVGVAGALWREYKNRERRRALSLPDSAPAKQLEAQTPEQTPETFDDLSELHHYQRVSWYALAFAASGTWFYPPVVLISIPLLGYNAYHFMRTLCQSDRTERRSPLAIFEMVGITATLATGRPMTASMFMLVSFGMRKLLLQAGTMAHNVGFAQAYNPRFAKVWVLRDGAEVETAVVDLEEGDIIVFHANDVIVVAGRVCDGAGTVHQYSLRKKMKSLAKKKGDRVFPFTRLESGRLYIQAD